MGTQKRHFGRIKCNLPSISSVLLEHNGKIFETLLGDISFTGALVKMEQGVPQDLKIGDECYLVIWLENDSNSIKHASKVTRLDSASVALNFLS